MSKANPNPYTAIWPGQPGGYVPVIAEELAAASAVRRQQAEAMAKGHANKPRVKPKATHSEAVKKARKRATSDNRQAFVPGASTNEAT